MLGTVFFLFFILEGSFAQLSFGVCDVDDCSRKYRNEIDVVITLSGDPPKIEAITKACPVLMKLTNCAEDKLVQCTGEKLEDLKTSDNISVYIPASLTLGIRRVLVEICNEASDMHKNYAQHVECVTKVVRRNDNTCWKQGYSLWTEYLKIQGVDTKEDNLREEKECIVSAYGASCFAVQLGSECGRKAKETFLDIGFGGLEVFKTVICRPSEYSYLRQGFLNSLQNGSEIRDAMQRAFEGSDYVGSFSNRGSGNIYLLIAILVLSLLCA